MLSLVVCFCLSRWGSDSLVIQKYLLPQVQSISLRLFCVISGSRRDQQHSVAPAQVRLLYSHLLCGALARQMGFWRRTIEWETGMRSRQQKHDENIATDLTLLSATTTWAEVMLGDDGCLSKEGRGSWAWVVPAPPSLVGQAFPMDNV